MLDEMLDQFNKAFRKFLNIHWKKNLRPSLSLKKVASLQADTWLKAAPAQLFSWVLLFSLARDTLKSKHYLGVVSTGLSFFIMVF